MNKTWISLIIILNLFALYTGMLTYEINLQRTNPLIWIFLIDCPIAVILFIASLWKKEFKPIAFMASIKYGIWTLLAYFFYWSFFSGPLLIDDSIFLIIGHLWLISQVLVFGFQKVDDKYLAIVLLFFLSNDLIDYFYLNTLTLPNMDFAFPLLLYNIVTTITLSFFIRKRDWKNFVEN